MADENKNMPALKQVYISGMIGGKQYDCEAIMVPSEMVPQTQYPYVCEAPDPKMEHPKYDYMENKWHDNTTASLGQQVTTIDKNVSDISAKVTSLQKAHEDVEKDVSSSNQQFTQLKQMLVSQTMMLNKIASAVKPNASTATPTPTTPQAAETSSKNN